MQGPAVLPNQPPVGIGDVRRPDGDDLILSSLGDRAPRTNEHFLYPPVDGGSEELPNGGPENGPNNLEDGRHLVAGPGGGIEDEEVFLYARLQQMEQEDLRAVENLLDRLIDDNVITAQHLWQILNKLRGILPEEGPYRILSSQAQYARILRRTARVMIIPTREMFETTRGPYHSLGYDILFQALLDSLPECPTEYSECLEKLCVHLNAGASFIPGDGVFIFKDREEFANSLRSLAALLTLVV